MIISRNEIQKERRNHNQQMECKLISYQILFLHK